MLKNEQKHCTGDDLSFIDHHIFLCTKKSHRTEIDKPAKSKCLLGEETLQIKT